MNRNRSVVGIMSALTIVMIMLIAGIVNAESKAEEATRQEVKTLVERGVEMAVVAGEKAVLKAISDPKGTFIKGDLYLYAGPLNKVTMSAHPYKPELVGKDMSTFRDGHGNFSFFEHVRIALEDGAGWTEYWWPKPGAVNASLKKSYLMKVPGKDMYIGGGYYIEEKK